MLTQQDVRLQLDAIADEVAKSPNVYYELFSRLFSERVQRWMRSVPRTEASVIRSVVERDPDYSANLATLAKQSLLFNPAWDFDY